MPDGTRADAPEVRELLVLRHAKSSWSDRSLPDHERPLADRGHHALEALHRHLAVDPPAVDLVLCSTARRAVDTLHGIRGVFASDPEVLLEHGLYAAGTATLLDRLQLVPDGVRSVLLVGHNPGLHGLVATLAGRGDPTALATIAARYPTGALATLRVPGPWSGLAPESCDLVGLVLPRELA